MSYLYRRMHPINKAERINALLGRQNLPFIELKVLHVVVN